MNFLNPPREIIESDFRSFVEEIEGLSESEHIVITFIPESKVYEANLPPFSGFDEYRKGRVHNIESLERRFREVSYSSIEQKTRFLVVRNAEIAQTLQIGKDDVGDIYSLRRTSRAMNRESNWTFAGKEYQFNKIEWDPNEDQSRSLSNE